MLLSVYCVFILVYNQVDAIRFYDMLELKSFFVFDRFIRSSRRVGAGWLDAEYLYCYMFLQ